jgi:hypothetical protein
MSQDFINDFFFIDINEFFNLILQEVILWATLEAFVF